MRCRLSGHAAAMAAGGFVAIAVATFQPIWNQKCISPHCGTNVPETLWRLHWKLSEQPHAKHGIIYEAGTGNWLVAVYYFCLGAFVVWATAAAWRVYWRAQRRVLRVFDTTFGRWPSSGSRR
jgi:hypothetical protein